MKKPVTMIFAIALTATTAAHANNPTVENALKNDPDVSSFYQGLINTGVINELSPSTSYTIFAPTNAAISKLTKEKYPCFYSTQCKTEVANVLRNHIVPEEISFSGPVRSKVTTIDKTQIDLAKARSGEHYLVDGNNVVQTAQLAGNIIYKIDGVISTSQELAAIENAKLAPATTTTVTTVSDPAPTPSAGKMTTTVTTTQAPQ